MLVKEMNDISDVYMNNAEIPQNGIAALKEALGVTGALKFLEQFDNGGYGDYTAEKYLNGEPELTDEAKVTQLK